MAISDELTRIQTAKADIKSAIEAKGVTVPNTALIDTYDTYIAQISGGGGGGQSEEDLKNLIERDITSITIPSGTTTIGEGAFQGCSVLTSITIPSGTTTIGNSAFQGCSVLTSVTIPNSVTEIGQSAFRTCANLTSVTIPDSVTSIGMNAFFDCINITSVTIGNGVISIGSRAFYNCTDLTSVTVQATTPPTLQNVNAFNNTNNCPIYVPAESVAAYKTASGWSSIASRIQGYDVA